MECLSVSLQTECMSQTYIEVCACAFVCVFSPHEGYTDNTDKLLVGMLGRFHRIILYAYGNINQAITALHINGIQG